MNGDDLKAQRGARDRERQRDEEVRALRTELERAQDDIRRVAKGPSLVTGPEHGRPRTGKATFA